MEVALIALATAFIIDVLLGDPPNNLHPVVTMGCFISWISQKWNQGDSSRRFWAGFAGIMVGGVLFSLPWLFVKTASQGLPVGVQGIIVGMLLKPTFAFRGLIEASREVKQALTGDNLNEARRLVAWHLVSRDTSQLSNQQVASATIESLAENLTDSFFAPLLCFSIGGLPLAWVYRFVNTADAMIGYRTPDYEFFGKFAARLDDLLNWLPARLAGFLLVVSAGLCRLDIKTAWNTMLKQHTRTNSPNAGWTMAAAAGALGVILEKKEYYRLEGGNALPQDGDIGRAMKLVEISLLVSLLFCGGIIIGSKLLF